MPRPRSPVRLEWMDPTFCSMDYRLKLVGRLPFFSELSGPTIQKINELFHDRDVQADQRIYYEGATSGYLYLVVMGKVKLVRNTVSGREVLLDTLRGGEYFGALTVLGGSSSTETAIAQTDCCILRISSTDFESIFSDHPGVARKALQVVAQRLTESQEIIKQLSTYSTEQRIAAASIGVTLLTGDNRLRTLATKHNVQVHGTLWILDEMVAKNKLKPVEAHRALTKMLEHGSWLPFGECQARLRLWNC